MTNNPSMRNRTQNRRRISNGRSHGGQSTHPVEDFLPDEEIQNLGEPSGIGTLGAMSLDDLRKFADSKKVKSPSKRRSDLLMHLIAIEAEDKGLLIGAGIIDMNNDGSGYLRREYRMELPEDIFVTRAVARQYRLRNGDFILGPIIAPRDAGKCYTLRNPDIVNGVDAKTAAERPHFDKFISVYPNQLIRLENDPNQLSTRLIDIIAPIGKGQRSLIVAPPKAGKTVILKQIASAITANNPEIHLMVALIGERPEEVTDIRRSVKGEIYSSTFDEPAENHCRTAEDALERARRLVETGEDVVLLLDSLTRLARGYNIAAPSSGKTLSGGMDPVALYPPKMFFGAARNCEGKGSLTIIATALVDTGSRLDDVIYEEFKGTGNMELHLDRRLAERRIFPSIDIERSGTRHEELLLDEKTLRQVWLLRRMAVLISQGASNPTESTERIIERLGKTGTNAEFLLSITQPGK